MIASKDRSNYFGASDTSYIVGNWNTKSFEKWCLIKLGIARNDFTSESIQAGNNYEHKILEALDVPNLKKDKQIIIDRLRVNLDGNTENCIYEVKTYNSQKEFKVSKQYWRQAQVEMYASNIKNLYIVAYGLVEKDYRNFFNEIDIQRLKKIKVDYDKEFIDKEYLPKLKYLSECLDKGKYPNDKEYLECNAQEN